MEPWDFCYGRRRRPLTFPKSKRRLIFDDSSVNRVDQAPTGQPPASNNCASAEDKERGTSASVDEREKASHSMGKFPSGSSSKEWDLQPGPLQTDYKERFVRLQMFLKRLDQEDLGDYKQILRSLSIADRSRHAVELEKRAIRLILDEGAELHKMKMLNVLGGCSSNPN